MFIKQNKTIKDNIKILKLKVTMGSASSGILEPKVLKIKGII